FAGRPPAAADGDLTTLAVVGQAVAAHEVYAAEKLHVVEVGAGDRNHLVSWLSNRLGISLIAPDLGKEGFSLVGGRLLPSGDKPAAQLMYEDESGGRVSLYVAHCVADEDSGFRLFERNGARAFYWHEKSFAYAVAGAASEERLLKLADATYRQLLQKN
ncbi:anti-sigma factor, partial [Nitratireductor sp. ZSWI3]|uniref:anti-sigma factor family protein n=1 Tax=Nitratireductor sp. ZSWI3 TaxID=2966359 RepID=UPI00214FDA2F